MFRPVLEIQNSMGGSLVPGIASQPPDRFCGIGNHPAGIKGMADKLAGPGGGQIQGWSHIGRIITLPGSGQPLEPSWGGCHQTFHLQRQQRLHQLISGQTGCQAQLIG